MKSKEIQLTDKLLELELSIERLEAVSQSFAERYIDITEPLTHHEAVAMSERHFENLYNAISFMIHDLVDMAEDALKDAEELVHAQRGA